MDRNPGLASKVYTVLLLCSCLHVIATGDLARYGATERGAETGRDGREIEEREKGEKYRQGEGEREGQRETV